MILRFVVGLTMAASVVFGLAAQAQQASDEIITIVPLDEPVGKVFTLAPSAEVNGEIILIPTLEDATNETREAITEASGAVLRGLDKVNGAYSDIELQQGATGSFGRLKISLSGCRFPTGNPAGDAFAYLSIFDPVLEGMVFEGWMIASAPALNALDHSRYDIWVLRCTTE